MYMQRRWRSTFRLWVLQNSLFFPYQEWSKVVLIFFPLKNVSESPLGFKQGKVSPKVMLRIETIPNPPPPSNRGTCLLQSHGPNIHTLLAKANRQNPYPPKRKGEMFRLPLSNRIVNPRPGKHPSYKYAGAPASGRWGGVSKLGSLYTGVVYGFGGRAGGSAFRSHMVVAAAAAATVPSSVSFSSSRSLCEVASSIQTKFP